MAALTITKIIYSAAAIQGVFLALLIFRTRVNQPANRILGTLLLLISFHLILVGFDEREFFLKFPHLSRVSWIIGSLYWPLLFLFVQYITQTQPDKIWKSLWPFIPFMVLFIIMLPYYSTNAAGKRSLLIDFEESSKEDFGWINQLVSVLHIVFQVFFLAYYIRFEKKLLEEYSEVDSLRIKWLKQFLLLLLAATILGVGAFFARTWGVPILEQLYSFHFFGVVLLFYWLSYKALTQPVLFGIVKQVAYSHNVTDTVEKYRKSSLEPNQLTAIFEKVKWVLEDQKLFLKSDLTLTELAAAARFPRHQVSQSINSCYKGNFFDLVNDYRVETFKQLALRPDKKHLNLLGIALEAGFNSKASFYAVFKKKTGMTPSDYLENQSKAA